MNVIITVFGGDCSDVVNSLEAAGYAPFIDGLHQKDVRWLIENFKIQHRFYEIINGQLVEYTADVIDDSCSPSSVITLCEGEVPPEFFWRHVKEFMLSMYGLNHMRIIAASGESMMVKPKKNEVIKMDEYDVLEEFDGKVGAWDVSATDGAKPTTLMTEGYVYKMKSEPPEIVGAYIFETKLLEDLDIKVYQVTKPMVLEPITVVVREWRKHGDVRFFTDIYKSNDWDRNVSFHRFDFPFLKAKWKELGLSGEFDRTMVDRRILNCYPQAGRVPDAEPEVYRKSMQSVIDMLQERNAPCNHAKRKVNDL